MLVARKAKQRLLHLHIVHQLILCYEPRRLKLIGARGRILKYIAVIMESIRRIILVWYSGLGVSRHDSSNMIALKLVHVRAQVALAMSVT